MEEQNEITPEEQKGEDAKYQPQDLEIKFSGDNKEGYLFISYKDAHKVAAILAAFLQKEGIDCRSELIDLTHNIEG